MIKNGCDHPHVTDRTDQLCLICVDECYYSRTCRDAALTPPPKKKTRCQSNSSVNFTATVWIVIRPPQSALSLPPFKTCAALKTPFHTCVFHRNSFVSERGAAGKTSIYPSGLSCAHLYPSSHKMVVWISGCGFFFFFFLGGGKGGGVGGLRGVLCLA